MSAEAALSAALASGAYEQLAPLCDAAELDVRRVRCALRRSFHSVLTRVRRAHAGGEPGICGLATRAARARPRGESRPVRALAAVRAAAQGCPACAAASSPAPLTRRGRSEAARLVWKRVPAAAKEARAPSFAACAHRPPSSSLTHASASLPLRAGQPRACCRLDAAAGALDSRLRGAPLPPAQPIYSGALTHALPP